MKIRIKVTPKAKTERVVNDGDCLRVYVTAAPESGKANAAVIKLLAKHFDVPPSTITIVSGHGSRDKMVRIGAT
ncbi:MAG: DUF167 domain-containing protein [Actinomycetota bacterium]